MQGANVKLANAKSPPEPARLAARSLRRRFATALSAIGEPPASAAALRRTALPITRALGKSA